MSVPVVTPNIFGRSTSPSQGFVAPYITGSIEEFTKQRVVSQTEPVASTSWEQPEETVVSSALNSIVEARRAEPPTAESGIRSWFFKFFCS